MRQHEIGGWAMAPARMPSRRARHRAAPTLATVQREREAARGAGLPYALALIIREIGYVHPPRPGVAR